MIRYFGFFHILSTWLNGFFGHSSFYFIKYLKK